MKWAERVSFLKAILAWSGQREERLGGIVIERSGLGVVWIDCDEVFSRKTAFVAIRSRFW